MRRSALTIHLGILAAALGALLGPGRAPAHAQTLADYDYDNLTFRGVGLGAGYLWSDRISDTQELTLRIDLGYMGPGVRIVPSVTYWASELADPEIDELATRLSQQTGAAITGADLGPIEWSDLSMAVDGHFVWSTPFGMLTFVGTGLGLHSLNGRGPAVDDTFVEGLLDDITVGVNGIVGLEFEPANRVRVFAEGRYTAMSSLRFAAVRGGVQIMLSSGNAEVGAVAPPAEPTAAGRAR